MDAAEEPETELEIEILWHQWASGVWRAVLTHHSTKEQREVSSEAELLQAVEDLGRIAVSGEN